MDVDGWMGGPGWMGDWEWLTGMRMDGWPRNGLVVLG